MVLTLVSPPAVEAVALDDVKAHLRVEGGHDDVLLSSYIAAAVRALDGVEGLLGRALITQTWRIELPRWQRIVELPLPPLQAVLSVTYRDAADVEQTLDPALYSVSGIGAACPAEVAFSSWPATSSRRLPIAITFRAGYGDSPNAVPAPIRAAILETIASRFDGDERTVELPTSALRDLDAFRMRAF